MKNFAPWVGVFETIRVENSFPQFPKEHWNRLAEGAKALGLKTPSLKTVLKLKKFPRGAVRWRWVLDGEGFREFAKAEVDRTPETMSLAVSPMRVGSENWDARFKTLSYLTHWQARKAVKADEALLLNERGEIASGAMTNVFIVKRGKILTPSVECGCRNGVIRAWVMKQVSVQTKRLTLQDFENADEIFLTNSWIGIRPVSRWNGRRMKIGILSVELKHAFERLI